MEKNKSAVVILSHADTEDKIEILDECVNELKSQGYPIIISSHINVPNYLYDKVDYVIYDKENPLIRYDEYNSSYSVVFFWSKHDGYEQSYPIEFNHAYAVLKLIKNGCSVGQVNGYEYTHFVNYDYVLKEDRILKQHSELLESCDIVSYDWNGSGAQNSNQISSGFFSVRNDSFLNLIKDIKSKEDYCIYGNPVFEEFLYNFIGDKLSVKTIPINDIITDENKIATKSILDNYIIEGKNGHILLFLSKDDDNNNYIFIKYNESLNLKINGFDFNSKPAVVNLISITEDDIKNEIKIEIPEFDIIRIFNNKTTRANCKIDDKNLITDIKSFIKNEVIEKKYTIEKYCDEDTTKRWDLINFLANEYNSIDYLEIGVFDGHCIQKIECVNKDGVDPGVENGIGIGVNYQMTSDEFFNSHVSKKYDIIFIDGLHHSDQVDKDIENSLNFLNDGGFILLHDCNPPDYDIQLVPRQTGIWNGDVWKSIVKLRCMNPNLDINVIDTDWGVGLIRRGSQELYTKSSLNDCLQWEYFDENREELLNIITVDEFYKKIKNKNKTCMILQ